MNKNTEQGGQHRELGKPGFQERTPCTVEGLRGGKRGEDWRVPKKQNWLQALEGKSHMLRLLGSGSLVECLPGTHKAPGSIP